MKRWLIPATLALVSILALGGCSATAAQGSSGNGSDAPATVTIALDWLAQPTNAGAYIALEKGYYADAGLDVTVQAGGTDASSIQVVAGGGAEFGLEYGGPILEARQKGIDVVALAPTLQSSPAVYVFHEGQDIQSLADLNGRTVYTQPASADWEYTVSEFGLDSVEAVQFQGSYAAFAADETAVAQGYATSTLDDLEAQGIAVESIPRVSEDDYGSILFTTQKLIDDNPELVEKFVAATVAGWDYIRDEPEDAAEILATYIEDSSVERILTEFTAQAEFIWTDDAATHQFGWQTQERWDAILDLQLSQGTVTDKDVLDGAWTTEYLPQS